MWQDRFIKKFGESIEQRNLGKLVHSFRLVEPLRQMPRYSWVIKDFLNKLSIETSLGSQIQDFF